MLNHRILSDKQNILNTTNSGTTDHTNIFKRTNIGRHGGSQRVQLVQKKRNYDEVEPQPPTFHADIQKNTKVGMQSHTHDIQEPKKDEPNVMTMSNYGCGSISAGPVVTFTGPREAFQMKADTLNILDAVLEKVEKIPINITEIQQMKRQVPNSLEILNAAIEEIGGTATIENAQGKKNSIQLKTAKKTKDTVTNKNAVRVGAAIPDAIKILNAAITKPEEYQNSRNSELTTYDQFYDTQSEYYEDILNYMVELEIKVCKPKPGYMDKQPEVTGAMRRKLVDWLVHVFKGTNDKVLHMTVNYIDTFLSRMSVVKSKLQLLACAAGMIACKTEEVYIRNAQYWLLLGGETFTKNQLFKMERIILSVMKFELCRPTIVCFIRHICFIGGDNAKDSLLANYISELVLIEGDVYLHYSPSLLASAIIALARHTLGQSDIWPQNLIAVTHHTPQQLLPIFALLRKTFNNAHNNHDTFVYKKYANKKLHEVAKLKLKQFKPEQLQ
ncbi:Cyclin A [Carabus blaptoides fortunei]